jgi:H+/gluconate symporter-like permease
MLTKFHVDYFTPHLTLLFSDLALIIVLPLTPSLRKRGLYLINRVIILILLIPMTNHFLIPPTTTLVTNPLLTPTAHLLLDE